MKLLEFIENNDVDQLMLEERYFDPKNEEFKGIFREEDDFEAWAFKASQELVVS